MRSILAATAAAVMVASGAVLAGAAPASAVAPAVDDGPYALLQSRVSWTVYAPSTTLGVRRSGAEVYDCITGPFLLVSYGRQALGARWIDLEQAPERGGCDDGPDGHGLAASFTVRGSTVTVLGDCAGAVGYCTSATPAGVRRGGFTTATFPATDGRSMRTALSVYTQGLSIAEIRRFVRSLRPV